jgi:hypothetical protein
MNAASTLMVSSGNASLTRRWPRLATLVAIAALLGVGYWALGSALYHAGFMADRLLFFAEKSDLALHGLAPRLINVGFIYPPLPYLMQLPFGSVIVGGAAVSGLSMALAIDFLAHRPVDPFMRGAGIVFLVASPLVLYLAVEDFAGLLFVLMAAASVHFLLRFLRDDYSLHLFIGSTLLGLTVFVDYRSIALLVAIVPAVGLPLLVKSRAQAMSVTLTILVPTVFFALAWMYLNWVFLSDPWAFVHGPTSIAHTLAPSAQMLATAGDLPATLAALAVTAVLSLPVSLPYFVGLASIRFGRAVFAAPAVAIYLVPLILLFVALYGGTFRPATAALALFVIVVLFSLEQMRVTPLLRWAFIVDPDERAFARALVGIAPPATLEPVRDVAAKIAGGPSDRVLLDDLHLYPLVHESGDPRRFLLPYQYDFEAAATNPAAFVRFVVLARRKDDMITALYPDAEFSGLPGFREIDRTPTVLVFEREAVR